MNFSRFWPRHSLKTRVTLFTLAIFVLSIWAMTIFASRMLRGDMQRQLGEQQFSTVSTLAQHVNDRLIDRARALEVIAAEVSTSQMDHPAALQAQLEQRVILPIMFNAGAFITGLDGRAMASVPASAARIGVDYLDRDFIVAALKEGRASVGRPVIGRQLKSPIFVMALPIRDARGKVIGALAGVTDLGRPNFLEQITQNRYGQTGGYLLMAPQHQLFVTATDKSRIMQQTPAAGLNAMHDKYMAGYQGFGVAVSSRGVPELSAARAIPAAGWLLVATLPAGEAFAPIDSLLRRMLLSALLFTLLAGALTWWLISRMLKQELAPMLSAGRAIAAHAAADQPTQALPVLRQDEIGELIGNFNALLKILGMREEALRESEQNLAITLNSIGDAVIATDTAGRVSSMNPAAERLCGWALAEAIGRPLAEVFCTVHATTREPVADPVQMALAQGRMVKLAEHTLLRSRNGLEYRIADSAAPIRNARGDTVGVVLVYSDDTEKHAAQEALNRFFEQPMNLHLIARPDGVIQRVNEGWKVMLGYERAELEGRSCMALVHPDDQASTLAEMDKLAQGISTFHFENRYRHQNGEFRHLAWSASISAADQLIYAVAGDITDRKQSEAVDRFLSQAGSSPANGSFFAALARFLADSLQMDYICIDRLEGDGLNATTLAVWHDGQFDDNLSYGLRDTPCGDVVGQRVCCFPANVCQLFPNDPALQDLRAESYIGVTLWDHAGQPIGLIAVIGRRALSNRAHAETTLERVALRAASELERLDSEAVLRRSEAALQESQRIAHLGGFVFDYASGRWTSSQELDALLGIDQSYDRSVAGWVATVHPDDRAMVSDYMSAQVAGGAAAFEMEHRIVRRCDQAERWMWSRASLERDAEGRALTLRGTSQDITARKQADVKLQLAASVFEHAREGIMITEPDGTIIDVNETFTRITGYTRQDALGQNPRILSSGRHDAEYFAAMWRGLLELGYWYGEIWNRRKDGEIFAEMQAISAVRDASGAVQHYVSLFSDITAIKEHQSQLEHIAHFDALTNLPNRVLLADRLQQAMAQAQRRGQQLAVVYLDLDGFKAINDQHGHGAGDQVLVTLARRMKQVLREGDSLARLGGDEFVAVLIDLEDTAASLPMLNRLLAASAQPVQVGDHSVRVSSSLGVTFYPQTQEIDADQLLRQADQAMYQAKLAGKNRYHLFDSARDSSLRGHHESVERIRLALEQREFVLHYQPKVNMRSGQVIGAEALIRWQHPEKGLLAPAVFLPVIEDHPLAVAIGEWVIDSALAQMELWHAAGLDLCVSVNVGARQLQQADFVERLRIMLAAHPQVRAGCFELEVLETSALEDIAQVSQVIEACAQFGVMFALDDFGTGYSSLTYLKRLGVRMLKIDRSFVVDMLDDPDDMAILEGVIGLAAAFRRQVLAEGVETVAHGSLLLQLGCELAQGYGIARPMPAHEMPAWTLAWRSPFNSAPGAEIRQEDAGG